MSFNSTVRELILQLRFAVDSSALKKVDSSIGNIQNKLAKIGSMDKVQQSVSSLANTTRKMALGFAAATGGVAFFLNEAGQFNKTQVAFDTMTGSIEKGHSLLKELHAFALKTPFGIKDVENNAAMLLGMGIETEKVIPTMKALGDVAAGINRPLGMVALNFGQIKTRGVLMGTELRDFARQGVPIIEQLSKQLGVTGAQIQEMTSKRLISFADVEKAFQDMTSEGGRFNDLMFKQAKTWPVMISNFLIQMRILAREVGQALLPKAKEFLSILRKWIFANKEMLKTNLVKFFSTFLKIVARIGRFLKDILPRVKNMVKAFGGFETVLKGIAIALGVVFGLQLANMIGTMVVGIGSLVGAMLGIVPAAVAANIAFGFLPILIGLATIALALLAQDIWGFFNGQDSLLGRLISRWSDWRKVLEDAASIISFLNPVNLLITLLNLITKLVTGKSLGEWLAEGLNAFFESTAYRKFVEFAERVANFLGIGDKGKPATFNGPVGVPGGLSPVGGGAQPLTRAEELIQAPRNGPVGVPGPSTSSTVVNQKNTFEINGAQDPEAVGTAVTESLGNQNRELMNNANGNRATSPKGN